MGAELVATIAITRDATTVFPKPRFSNLALKAVPLWGTICTIYTQPMINKFEARNPKSETNQKFK
jgi:hypothetical protein